MKRVCNDNNKKSKPEKAKNRYFKIYDNRRLLSKNHKLCTNSTKFIKDGIINM